MTSSHRYECQLPNFNPTLTLTGGQAFRWERRGDGFYGVACGVKWRAHYQQGRLRVESLSRETEISANRFTNQYFDLERNYADALNTLQRNAELRQFTDIARGVRILRQPWFETMISFVVSANNHIARITRIIELLCQRFGMAKPSLDGTYFCFPTPERLAEASLTDLRRNCNAGYRDRYIRDLSARVAENFQFWNDQAHLLPTEELRRQLLTLPGVGPKVAECILLFGFSRWDAFPIDTWIRRAAARLYFTNDGRPTDKEIAAVARVRFGSLAGLAQQCLFEAARLQSSPAD
jgi:N-glycosylase/DNA lyase